MFALSDDYLKNRQVEGKAKGTTLQNMKNYITVNIKHSKTTQYCNVMNHLNKIKTSP